MKKKDFIKNVVKLVVFNKQPFIVGGNGFEASDDYNSYVLGDAFGSRPVVGLGDYLLIQEEQFNIIYVIDKTGQMTQKLDFELNLYQILRINPTTILVPCKQTKTYWRINETLTVQDLNVYFKVSMTNSSFCFDWTNKILTTYKFFEPTILWSLDISTFGRNIRKHRDTGEVLSDKPNEMDGNLFGYQGLLYVPLAGGQLLALSAESGKEIWMLEHEISGAYQIYDSKIYKKDIKQVFEIGALTGEVLRHKELRKEPVLSQFSASGPLWVYEDIIIAADVLKGDICILERSSLNVLEFFTINQKLPYTNDAIVWHENKLYVLDLENTLHIFEREV